MVECRNKEALTSTFNSQPWNDSVTFWAKLCGKRRNGDNVKSDVIVNFSDKDNKLPFLIASNLKLSEEVCRGDA